jgi:hypothetical protein
MTIIAGGKAISVTYSDVCLYYIVNGTIFGKKVAEHKRCVFILSTTFV